MARTANRPAARPARKPVHTHDCDDCRFLGTFQAPTGCPLDFYLCPHGDEVICRHGSDGPAYRSLPLSMGFADAAPAWYTIAVALVKQVKAKRR